MNKINDTFFDPTTLKVGNHTYTLKNCKRQIGHDDSTPYTATLYIDNKRICTLFNDGWGGETNITQVKDAKTLEMALNDLKGQPYPFMPWDEQRFDDWTINGLSEVVDTIAESILYFTPLYNKYGVHKTIFAIDKNSMVKYCILNTEKLSNAEIVELSKRKSKEYAEQGYYILSAPHFFIIGTK